MRIKRPELRQKHEDAFTIIETLVAIVIIGIVCIALYTGLSSGWSIIRAAREDLRATQIMLEKLETIRLYNWDQINDTNFIPEFFVEAYYPTIEGTNAQVAFPKSYDLSYLEANSPYNDNVWYRGQITIQASTNITESYSNELRQVTIELTWKQGDQWRTREATTFVSSSGLQKYIY